MKCSRCQHENYPKAKFCEECGTALSRNCVSCGTQLSAAAKFCPECGAVVAAPGGGRPRFASPEAYTPKHLAERILTSRSALEGERKHVTVLFADMKGSMELLADRDPEEARNLLDPVLERMMEAVHHYEGTVNQVMGDGIMGLFGAPLAHEDHAVRACHAALRMQESVKRYSEEAFHSHGARVHIRVGLNSGEVVVRSIGSDLRMDYTAVGQTTHLASRMEQLAAPGTILLTPDTLRLVEGFVQVRPLGPVPVKGLTESLEVFELTGATVRRRFEVAAARGLTRFVGRETELDVLRQAIERARAGRGQVVAPVGEPGVGKSRLFWEFTRSYHTRGWLILEIGAVSYGKSTPYLPVIDLLKAYFRIQDRDDHREIREKVIGRVFALDRALEPSLPAFLALLDVPVDDAQWQALDPSQRRQRSLDAVKRLVLRESQVQPLLLVFEDLHWIDSETQAVLDGLVDSLPTARILLLVNYRPEYQHQWASKTYYHQLPIDPLPPESAEELLDSLLGTEPALKPVKRLVIERTEGNPFFLEESVRTLVETRVLVGERGAYRPARRVEEIRVPATVQAVLAARIDRLPPNEKELLQLASVIGKDVPVALLRTIVDRREEEVRRDLSRLQAAEFMYETSVFPDLEYTFKHTLTHEVAYRSLLRATRQEHHRRIAKALEEHFPGTAETRPELLAHHYTEAGLSEKAIPYWHRAGQRAIEQSANVEAIDHLTKGLDALKSVPDGPERLRIELDLQTALGPALMATKGFGASEVVQTYARARELCQQVGETPQLFTVLRGLWEYYWLRTDVRTVLDLAQQLYNLAQRSGDTALRVVAHDVMGDTSLCLGDFAAARSYMEQGIALYDPSQHRSLAFRYGGYDPAMACRSLGAHALWYLGYPDRALEWSREALALTRELSHPPSLVFALSHAGVLHQLRREPRLTLERADAAITLSTEQGFAFWLAFAAILKGWALVKQGQGPDGIEQMQQGLGGYRVTGGELERPLWLAMLADAYQTLGRPQEGLATVEEALIGVQDTGVRFIEAELYRLKGELLLAQAGASTAEAERCFRQAFDIAASQRARSLELRAAMSLTRLLRCQGERELARRTLAEVCGWFTEGFDTDDLREARALLEEPS